MRFLVDMPLSPDLVAWLARCGHDAVHASLVGLAQSPDVVILERARIEDRIVLTADLDYSRLLAISHAETPGLILFRGGNYSDVEIEERLTHLLGLVPETDLVASVLVIEKARIRRRRLPL